MLILSVFLNVLTLIFTIYILIELIYLKRFLNSSSNRVEKKEKKPLFKRIKKFFKISKETELIVTDTFQTATGVLFGNDQTIDNPTLFKKKTIISEELDLNVNYLSDSKILNREEVRLLESIGEATESLNYVVSFRSSEIYINKELDESNFNLYCAAFDRLKIKKKVFKNANKEELFKIVRIIDELKVTIIYSEHYLS